MSILRLILLLATTSLAVHIGAAASAPAPIERIVAQAAPPPVPTPPPPTATQPAAGVSAEASLAITVVAGLILIALALPGAWLAGAFRRGSIAGPLRLPPGSPVLPILLALLIGGTCWFGGQMLFIMIRGFMHAVSSGGQTMTMDHLGPGDMAMIATFPSLLALLIILGIDARFGLVRAIGLRGVSPPWSLLQGFIAGVIALLLTYGASSLLGVLYKLIEYEHPTEHDLLGAMKSASVPAKALLVFGACVMAPLFEEVLFRGHMQTLLTRLFTPRPPMPAVPMMHVMPAMGGMPPTMSAPAAMAAPSSSASSPSADVLPVPPLPPAFMTAPWESPPPPPLPMPIAYAAPAGPPVALRWLAVIITSVIFAIIHPLWTAPMIFLLSLCLGYAYERTGSLWVPILMHAMFNTTSTLMFLLFM